MVALASWSDFYSALRWEQGEHVSLIGPTGAGKTTLARALLPRRRFVLALACKPRDPVVDGFRRDGYRVARRLPLPPAEIAPRVVYWPRIEELSRLREQRAGFARVIADIYRQGAWTLYVDELAYVSGARYLNLASDVELMHFHGRSLGVSVVAGTQRPAHVPLTTYSQASHLFLWGSRDVGDARRLREIGRADPREVQAALDKLGRHDFLYVDATSGAMVQSRAPWA